MDTIDVRGLSCPIPVLKTQKALAKSSGELEVIGSGNVSKENVTKFALSQGCQVNFSTENPDEWTMQITKPK
ncbi:MAG: SirA family protein [Syntrophomonadaceae bacterium]|nr:SirA family protein [Syntrophomonadaceae bacterium]